VNMFRVKNEKELISYGPRDFSPERQPDGRSSVDKSREMIETAMRKGYCFFEWTHKRLDGVEFPADVLLTRVEQAGKQFLQATVRDITDRKRSEEALIESKEYLNNIINAIGDPVFVKDNQYRFILANDALCRMIGAEREDVIGKTLGESLPEDQMEHFLAVDKIVLESGQENLCEEPLTGADGKILTIVTRKSRYIDEQGNKFLVGVIRDITERKHSEESLRRLATVVKDSNDAITIQDFEGRITAWNRGAELMYGYTEEEALRMSIWDLTPPDKVTELKEVTHRLMEGEKITTFETKRIAKDGRVLDVWLTITKLVDDSGKIIGIASTARDVTDRKRSDEVLREQEFKLRSITDTAQDAILMMDDSGRITFWNPAAERIFGYGAQEALGKDLHALIAPQRYHEDFQEAYPGFLNTGEGKSVGKTSESKALRKDGREIDVELSLASVRINDRWHAAGTVRDISERKLLEEQYRQAMKMETVGRLAGGVAHDFNNMLTVITGYTDMMLTQLDQHDPLCKDVIEVQNAADRAANLTRQLLAFSRKQILEPQIINLNSVLADLHKMLHRVIGEDIDLATVPNPELCNIEADPGQIEQVIVNLVVNARDSMPSGGKLTIETQNIYLDEDYCRIHTDIKPGDFAMIAVSDNGCGISQEIISKIFEPFFTTKEVGKGTGLGLATVFGIVKQSGGSINVYSEVGKGSSFKIYFPKKDMVADAITRRTRQIEDDGLRGTGTILIVEDEEIVREMAVKVLKTNGYNVITAQTGNAALLICRQMDKPVDLVLTDVVMPGISGIQFIGELRKFWPNTKVIFMSGYTPDAILHQGILEPGTPFIGKPFRMAELLKKVKGVIKSAESPTGK
jgi:two-component system cell cycle sensor histidine kinase/response regulator CckA